MATQYAENVVQTLAQHLGVKTREIALAHDLYRDWGLTPLALVIILLDLERSVAIALPPEELSGVRTVADLVSKFRSWVHAGESASAAVTVRRARRSRSARRERRLRRELHHLRWLEQNAERRAVRLFHSLEPRPKGAGRGLARG